MELILRYTWKIYGPALYSESAVQSNKQRVKQQVNWILE